MRARTQAIVRRHWLFIAAVLVGSALRALASIGYQPALFGGGDSISYISNAENLRPTGFRPAGYPVFLWLLSFTKSLAVVTVSQHVLTVAAATALYVVLLRFGLRPTWAAIAVTPFLLDAYQIDNEQFIFADALAEVLVVAGLVVLVGRRRPTVVQVLIAGLLLATASVTRTVGLAILPLALLYLLVVRAGWVRVVAFGAAAGALLLAYAGWYDAANNQFTLTSDSGFFLYGRVAPFANCNGLSLPPLDRRLCQSTPPATRPFSGWYLWNHQSPLFLYIPQAKRLQVAGDFADRIVAHQPLTYLAVSSEDTLHYFAPGHPIGRLDWPIQSSQFPPLHPAFSWAIALATVGYNGRHVVPRFVPSVAAFLRGYQRFVYTPGPVFAACLALAIAGGAGLLHRRHGVKVWRYRRWRARHYVWLADVDNGRRPSPGAAARYNRAVEYLDDVENNRSGASEAVRDLDLDHHRAAALLFALAGFATIASASFTAEFSYRYGLFLIPLLPPAGVLAAATVLPASWTQRLRVSAAPAASVQPIESM